MFGQLPKWRAAREIIDWTNPGRSLLDDPKYKKKQLSEKTLNRIAKGLEKFGGSLAPLYIQLLGLTPEGTTSGDVQPFVMGKQGNSPAYRGVNQPAPTITTSGHPVLVEPIAEPFLINHYQNNNRSLPRNMEQPVFTITSHPSNYLIEPVAQPFIVQNRIRPDGDRVYDIDKPMLTVTGHGAGAVVTPMMIEYYGTSDSVSIDKPLPTVTTKDRFGLVTPLAEPIILEINHSKGNGRPGTTDDPLKTLTTKQSSAIVTPVIESATQNDIDPRRLVMINGEPYVLDLRFRMLNNLELARAMGFTDSESTYEFTGNSCQITKQIGNAVPVNMAKALVKAILGSK